MRLTVALSLFCSPLSPLVSPWLKTLSFFLLSEVVIYKHQFVSTDWGLAVVCQSDNPAGKI